MVDFCWADAAIGGGVALLVALIGYYSRSATVRQRCNQTCGTCCSFSVENDSDEVSDDVEVFRAQMNELRAQLVAAHAKHEADASALRNQIVNLRRALVNATGVSSPRQPQPENHF